MERPAGASSWNSDEKVLATVSHAGDPSADDACAAAEAAGVLRVRVRNEERGGRALPPTPPPVRRQVAVVPPCATLAVTARS